MATIWDVILFSLIGSMLSLIGGVLILSKKSVAYKMAFYATPFAAGVLLSAAFMGLLREGVNDGNPDMTLFGALLGIIVFFTLERSLRWFHHHHQHGKEGEPVIPMIIIGDTIHNFLDGLAIAAGFLIDYSVGVVTTLAVGLHEIPQEVGDFGLLLSKGMSRRGVIIVNVMSALATVVGALFLWILGKNADIDLSLVFGLTAGFFIYIAVSDIIPSIHANEEAHKANQEAGLLLLGAFLMGTVIILLGA